MNQADFYIEAVKAWQQSNKNLKHFAECCYHVNGKQTKALAADCGVTEDTIENYRNAYTLYVELENFRARSEVWEKANISLWVKAAQLRIRLNLSLKKTWDYLQTASLSNMTRESFAAHVDELENDTPKWVRRLQHAVKILFPSREDWKSEMPVEKRDRYEKATAWYVNELKEIAEKENETA